LLKSLNIPSTGELYKPQNDVLYCVWKNKVKDKRLSMSDLNAKSQETTRYLGPLQETPVMPKRVTGPLDEPLPWVIDFRVVGTPSTIQVRVAETMTIGRSDPESGTEPDINLAPFGAHVLGVSRKHAVVKAKNDRLTVLDTGSANGTRLNGFALVPNQEYRLRHGDELTVGQLHLQVMFVFVPVSQKDTAEMAAAHTAPAVTDPSLTIPKLGSGQHVLVVEDDIDVATVIGMILEHAGFKVTVLNNAEAAVGFVTKTMPDAIVLDLMLPDMSGLDLARYVRKQEQPGQHVAVVVVSGATGGFQMNQAKQAGVDLFLGKPVGVSEIVQAFTTLVPQM
jgi:CheY-like chemotaxis protein